MVLGCPLQIQQRLQEQAVPITTTSLIQTREIKDTHPLGPDNLL
jgi:hypothetical protein